MKQYITLKSPTDLQNHLSKVEELIKAGLKTSEILLIFDFVAPESLLAELIDEFRKMKNKIAFNNTKYRIHILKETGQLEKIKFAGTDKPSWLTLARAKELVDRSNNEAIFEYDQPGGNQLWEIL